MTDTRSYRASEMPDGADCLVGRLVIGCMFVRWYLQPDGSRATFAGVPDLPKGAT